ncbi:MAG: hypothetical protein J2P56_03345 [Verrucomicrobia bacterium]|nr:hypothetical protein [Verrucomicrobiota bacterium]
MNEPYFRDYHLHPDERADVRASAIFAEHAERKDGAEYLQELAAGDDNSASDQACTTKVQFPASHPAGYTFSGSPSQSFLFGVQAFDWGTAMRGPHVNE